MGFFGELPTLSWIENYTTDHFHAAAKHWADIATTREEWFTKLASDILRPGGYEWRGPAAEAAQDRVDAVGFAVRGACIRLADAADIAKFADEQLTGCAARP